MMRASTFLCCAAVALLQLLVPISAHVSLTYPPARAPNYDFLDNIRTGGPCGVPPRDGGTVTRLRQGSTFNVTFNLAYSHRLQGGILVNILATNGTPVDMLLNNTWQQLNDSSAYVQEVTLPVDFTCDRCILQLLRQAQEWQGGYTFWSCVDISVVNENVCSCLNNYGTCDGNRCICIRGFVGENFQFQNEYEDDSDCNSHGSCIDLESISYPRKQCFCDAGWFGLKCAQASGPPVDLRTTNPSSGTITVQWSAPPVPNGIITGYRVYFVPFKNYHVNDQMYDPSQQWVIEVTQNETTLTGLYHDTTYTIYITALNEAGEGKKSETAIQYIPIDITPDSHNGGALTDLSVLLVVIVVLFYRWMKSLKKLCG